MKEFIYSIREVFSVNHLFNELQAEKFFIGSYQRGYKWKSFTLNDQVPLFLLDIYDAYKNDLSEYYLQYITIKKNEDQPALLEVIDGQQRLTTLSLFFYTLEYSIHKKVDREHINISENKLIFERYHNRDIFLEIQNIEGSDLDIQKKQDIYYLYHAKECILNFIQSIGEELLDYVEYLKNRVKLIINLEDEFTSAEEVFSNLNDNKVDLTNYYLIKGLLFTKSTRNEERSVSFSAIQEQRTRIVFQWDEINNWLLDEEKNQLFFSSLKIHNNKEKNIGINSLLTLLQPEVKEKKRGGIGNFNKYLSKAEKAGNEYELFNLYNDYITCQEDAEKKLNEIKETSYRFRNWYVNTEMHNLIGYFIYTNGNLKNIYKCGKEDLKKILYKHLYERLETNKKIEELNFEEDKSSLNFIFLAVNVFPLLKKDDLVIDYSRRFDFYQFRKRKWSIEHIYPQNPDATEDDFIEFKNWFRKRAQDRQKENWVKRIDEGEMLLTEEIKDLCSKDINEHGIGNLTLLETGDNSALQNYIYPKKRKILLERISQGAFVPSHTINIVSKMLTNIEESMSSKELLSKEEVMVFDEDINDWSSNDCTANSYWICNTYRQLLHVIKKEL